MALEAVAPAVRAALGAAPSLHRWAAGRAERVAMGGRGPLYVAALGPVTAAVRRYRRGGWMAPLLGDRYLGGPPRPHVELAVSERARGAGVPTPRVLAAVVAPARPGYRAEIATEWLSPGHDLTALLLPGSYDNASRAGGLAAAGAAIGRAHAAGLDHPDLNAGNMFLLPGAGGAWSASILDLDRAVFRDPAPPGEGPTGFARRNLERLERSIGKLRRAGRARWPEGDRAALLEGWRRGARELPGPGGSGNR